MRDSLVVTAVLALLAREAHAQQGAPAPQAPPPPIPVQEAAQAVKETLTRPAPKITFEEAIHRAMTRNPSFELAEQDVRRAQALVEQVRSTWLPTLNANGTYTRLDDDRTLAGRVIAARDSVNGNVTLTVPIIAPRQWVNTARAKDNREIAKLTLTDTRRQVALQAGRAYLTIIAQRRVLESSLQARDTARAHEEFSKSRLADGVGNRLDAVRASQERSTSETRVQNQIIALARAQEALGILLGESGPVDAGEVSLGAPPTLDSALTDAEHRSDVAATKERAESARKSVRDSYADYLPFLTGVV